MTTNPTPPDTTPPDDSATDAARGTTALVSGGSKGLGRALVLAFIRLGWSVITDGRTASALEELAADADAPERLTTIVGDVTDPAHRAELVAAVERNGRLDALINNASTLGATPLRPLATHGADELSDVLRTNLLAPHALTTALLPALRESLGVVINVTSDAAVEGYETWGPYGASKAALEQWSNVLAAEEPTLSVYWIDPGDLRTDMHQAAFPGEDISDRPLPDVAVPGFLRLVDTRPPSGRFSAQQLASNERATLIGAIA